MDITREIYEKIEGLKLVGLRDVLINVNRIQFDTDNHYDLGVRHGVSLMTDRILEEYGFERSEIDIFYKYAQALESEDAPVIVG